MITQETCPVCRSAGVTKLVGHLFEYPGDDIEKHLADIAYERLWILFRKIIKQYRELLFSVLFCNTCGLIFITPRLSEEEVRKKYEAITELGSVKHRLQQDKPVDLEKRADYIYNLTSKFIDSKRSTAARVLDFGGASGYNLIPFVDKYDCGVIDYERWDLPTGVRYLGENLSELTKDDRFDLILFLHTLEHVAYPKDLINQLSNFLTPNGIIYIEVPLGCFMEWKFISEPITHINFFSEESLFNCLHTCGLNVVYMTTAYQRVVRAKTWCVNAIGANRIDDRSIKKNKVLSTRTQMTRSIYYLPYILNARAYRNIMRKVVGI